jgi:hypothetical protein
MKISRLLSLAALAIGALMTSPAHAQAGYDRATPLTIASLATTITNSATSNYTAVVNVRKADTVGIFQKFQLNGAGTGGNIIKFSKSVDGVNFETTPSILITNASAGTTATYYFNSVSVAGAAAIRLESVVNGSAAALTNVLIQVGIPTRP